LRVWDKPKNNNKEKQQFVVQQKEERVFCDKPAATATHVR
jgi:hypothetical protein